jgi:hypothetical protein
MALNLFRRADHKRGEAGTLNAAGWLLIQLGDYEQAWAPARTRSC